MCIIVYKPAGIDLPNELTLFQCGIENPDGIGIMYRDDYDRVCIIKGFYDIVDLLDTLDDIPDIKNKDLAIHFRYATHGEISPGNCHPFPITKKIRDLRKTRLACSAGIMHNGIVNNMTHTNKTLSDTMIAIKIISDTGVDSISSKTILKSGKWLIMDKDNVSISGEFIYDNGVYYSNYGYITDIYDDKEEDIKIYDADQGRYRYLSDIEYDDEYFTPYSKNQKYFDDYVYGGCL